MSTSTRRRARQKPAATPVSEDKSCEVCHIPGDDKTLKNWGEYSPYWMCKETPECDARALEAHRKVHQDDAPQPETDVAAAEETAEVTG